MPKNIVILIDGTGKELEVNQTNVLRLARVLRFSESEQVFYYDPGVGTQGAPSNDLMSRQELIKILGLGLGLGLYDKMQAAYRYLMETYEPGDRLFLFGFSRGAYIARALAGLIGKVGILERQRTNLVSYAVKLYCVPRNARLANDFTSTFCDRHCDVRFLGLWDTVKSVFRVELRPPQITKVVLPRTMSNPMVRYVRHALAIDERRRFFRTNKWQDGPGADPATDIKQVWFAGTHSDVGGGWPDHESGLAKISFYWMLREAMQCGLLVDEAKAAMALGQMGPDRRISQPDSTAPLHESLGGWWHAAEIWPKVSRARAGLPKVYLPLGEPRFIPDGAILHESVLERMDSRLGYRPKNLPPSWVIEPW
jgi:uncharacterized protein (DUF2235 family)